MIGVNRKNLRINSIQGFAICSPGQTEKAVFLRAAEKIQAIALEWRYGKPNGDCDMATTWTEVVISWIPMLLLIAVWIYFIISGGKAAKGKNGKSYGEMLEEHLSEMKRQNDLLEKIMNDQELRLQRLETKGQ